MPVIPTVDGSEIRRSPVDMVKISHYFHGFIMFYTSQVVQDFFHQQYARPGVICYFQPGRKRNHWFTSRFNKLRDLAKLTDI